MTWVVPCLDNKFLVLLISALAKIGVTKLIFLDSDSPMREGGFVCAWAWFVTIVYIVHILNSSKNSFFFVSNTVELPSLELLSFGVVHVLHF